MIVLKAKRLPNKDYSSYDKEVTEFNFINPESYTEEYKVVNAKLDILAYWHSHGNYEGTGCALFSKDGLWYYEYLGHCSCYGPWDSFGGKIFSGGAKSYEEIYNSASDDLRLDLDPLMEVLREHKSDNGYGESWG